GHSGRQLEAGELIALKIESCQSFHRCRKSQISQLIKEKAKDPEVGCVAGKGQTAESIAPDVEFDQTGQTRRQVQRLKLIPSHKECAQVRQAIWKDAIG